MSLLTVAGLTGLGWIPTKRLPVPPTLPTKLFVCAEKMSTEAFDRSARYISCVFPSKYAMS
jgi:hypothetical protein